MFGQSSFAVFLVNLGAVAGLLAAGAWWQAWRRATTRDPALKVNTSDADTHAKLLTAVAFGLVSLGYLWGQVAG